MNTLGLYFGPKSISMVVTKGKKLVNNISIPQTTISTKELEEKVPADVKLIEIIALIKDELRRNRIETRDISLCLSGKDLIIRSFEMPLLPKEELKSAINFEAKKYIPFKVEDLITGFHVKYEKESHINLVLFVGIKKDTFERYTSIIRQLDMNMVSIEYSAFSILRVLNLARLSEKGIYGMLSIDVAGEDEINFSVVEDGFPLFSRDIVLAVDQQQQLAEGQAGGEEGTLEKLKTEIRVSFDYYHRKFPTKNIKKVYLLCSEEMRPGLEAYMGELGIDVSFADITRHIDKSLSYSLSFIKGYSASLSRAIKSNIKIDLLGEGEKAEKIMEPQAAAVSFLQGLELDYRIVFAGILICASTFLLGFYRSMPIRGELKQLMAVRATPPSVKSGATYAELQEISSGYKKKFESFTKLIKQQLFVSAVLDVMPRVLPKGAWLKQLTYRGEARENEGSEFIFEGNISLADSDQEFEAVNMLVSDLRGNPEFSRYFKDISIVSLSSVKAGSMAETNFIIRCKESKGGS